MRPASRLQLLTTGLALAGFATLSGCCGVGTTVLLDERVPHQVARETSVVVWGKTADGRMKQTEARLPAGWWIAGPQVTDPVEAK